MGPVIPAEAVEAAAIVLWDKEMNAPWSSVADGFKAPFMRDALRIIEAAVPYMLAEAFDKGVVAGVIRASRPADPQPTQNPYRSTK